MSAPKPSQPANVRTQGLEHKLAAGAYLAEGSSPFLRESSRQKQPPPAALVKAKTAPKNAFDSMNELSCCPAAGGSGSGGVSGIRGRSSGSAGRSGWLG